MSASMTRKLMSAVNSCQSLTSLEFAGFRQFSRSSAIALASALKCNKTLQKLRVRFMADDVLGIILASLKHNEALQELSLDYSVDLSRSSLWDGLQALRENRVLKRLELTEACFSSSCGIVIAEVLRYNNTIEELSLSSNFIGDLGARALAKALQESSTLKHLDVSNCRLTSNVLSKFVEAVSRNSAIECVRLGHIDIPEDWAPTLPLRDVCARLQVSWNTPVLEQWAACQVFRFSKARLAWTVDSNCSGIVQWFAAARVNSASLVELVIECPCRVDAESTEAVVSFLETTRSLKKVIMRPFQYNYVFSAAILNSLARNKSVREAEFDQTLRAHLDVKALEALLVANRTLHRLKFRYDSLPCSAPVMLARALKDNFVFLTLEFEDQNAQNDMYPVLKILNRNRSLLNRAVECVLDSARDEHSQGALRLLCDTDSLLDAVAVASGKVREECRCLVLEAVRSLELQHSEDTLSTEKMNVCDRTQCN
uniref:Protein nlrc3 n=1 Tax=Rhipicephalus appendiculatus TaxID=34631 RepID=A0A131YUJ2_RHIAP